MKNILNIKHWQLFIILTWSIFLSLFIPGSDLKIGNLDSLEISALIRITGVFIIFLWLLTLGLSMNKRVNNPYKFKSWLFITANIICILGYSELNLQALFSENYPLTDFIGIFLFPLNVAGLLYILYALPISLKSLETGRRMQFGDCRNELLLFIFFPIGIWFLQPRINKLFVNKID